jgi:Ankyrin repeat
MGNDHNDDEDDTLRCSTLSNSPRLPSVSDDGAKPDDTLEAQCCLHSPHLSLTHRHWSILAPSACWYLRMEGLAFYACAEAWHRSTPCSQLPYHRRYASSSSSTTITQVYTTAAQVSRQKPLQFCPTTIANLCHHRSPHRQIALCPPCAPRPLHVAVVQGDVAIVECLLAYGADLNARTCNDSNRTPLEFAFLAPRGERGSDNGAFHRYPILAAALLVERGASVSGLAAEVGEALGLDGVLEAFADNPGLWDVFVARK